MSDLSFKSIEELQAILGEQLQGIRLSKNLDQITTAEKAGMSDKALRNLETGRGSTLESLLRVLKALDSLDGLELLAPKPSVSPPRSFAKPENAAAPKSIAHPSAQR